MKVSIIRMTKAPIPRRSILKLANIVASGEKAPEATVNIVFIGDRRIKSLNRKYRGIHESTDVLSFNIDDSAEEESVFGEIYISTETAARYAKADKIGVNNMILKLCCHGFLHLMGYDHQKPYFRKKMEGREAYYLGRMNVK